MRNYIVRRLLQLIPILLCATFLVSALMYYAPGDPVQRKLTAGGIAVSGEVLDQAREEAGLTDSLPVQYGRWLLHALKGDLGTSHKDGRPVAEKLWKGLKNTALLSALSFLAAVLIAFPLGVCSALYRNRGVDYLIRFFSFIGNSLPNFLLSVLLMYALCVRVKWFPVMAGRSLRGIFLPVLALTIPVMSCFIRQVRAEVLEQLHRPYVDGARSRGVKERYILLGNVLRNSMISLGTILALTFGSLMTGSVVIETVFMWQGLGKLMMDSITARDYPVIQGAVVLMAVLYTLVNLAADIAGRYLDPRIGEEGAKINE